MPRVFTRSARSGSAATSPTSATAARWMTASQPLIAPSQRVGDRRMSPTKQSEPRRRRDVRETHEVEDARLVAELEQAVDHVGADEARSARDEDSHMHRPFCRRLERRLIVQRHAPVVLPPPSRCSAVRRRVPSIAVARLVVHLAGRALDRLEDDVLVEPGDHPVRQLDASRDDRASSHSRAASFFQAVISSSRSTPTMPSAAVNSFMRKLRPGCA